MQSDGAVQSPAQGSHLLSAASGSNTANTTRDSATATFQNATIASTTTAAIPTTSRSPTAGYYVVLVLMGMLIATAVAGNLSNVFVILRWAHLRHSLSNFFLLSLCLCDLLAAILVMPTAAITFGLGYWPLSDDICRLTGLATSLFMFVSMTTLSVISMERFYSIRLPMHHAAHMTVSKTVVGVVLVWLWSALLAVLPLVGMGSYGFRISRYHCSFTWHAQGRSHLAYVVLVVVLCFLLPGLLLLTMYLGVFFVARRAATQVRPIPHGLVRPAPPTVPIFSTSSPGEFPVCGHVRPSGTWPNSSDDVVIIKTSVQKTARSASMSAQRQGRGSLHVGQTNDEVSHSRNSRISTNANAVERSAGNGCFDKSRNSVSLEDSGIASQADDVGRMAMRLSSEHVVVRQPKSYFKPVKTLLILLLAYLLLWGPYFLINLYGVIHALSEESQTAELVALWLSLSSFAVNPLLYGWMNKSIREELMSLYRRVFCSSPCCHKEAEIMEDDISEGPPGEDFLQFLERTSRVPMASRQTTGCSSTQGSFHPDLSDVNIESSGPF